MMKYVLLESDISTVVHSNGDGRIIFARWFSRITVDVQSSFKCTVIIWSSFLGGRSRYAVWFLESNLNWRATIPLWLRSTSNTSPYRIVGLLYLGLDATCKRFDSYASSLLFQTHKKDKYNSFSNASIYWKSNPSKRSSTNQNC